MDRRVLALHTALRAAVTLPGVAPTPLLVIGHSEGGMCGAALARVEPAITHLALLASTGLNQLHELTIRERIERNKQLEGQAQESVAETWQRILQNPNSVEDFAWGHPYRRWTSFLSTSTVDELRGWRGKIYAAHGALDEVVPRESFDNMVEELSSAGADLTVFRFKGAHSLYTAEEGLLERIVDWCFENPETLHNR